MSESCFKLIHSNRLRGVQHSAEHSLPTALHKMVMRALLSADNEIDAASTASRSRLVAYFTVWKNAAYRKRQSARGEMHFWYFDVFCHNVYIEKEKKKTEGSSLFCWRWTPCSLNDRAACATPPVITLATFHIWQQRNQSSKLIYHNPSIWDKGFQNSSSPSAPMKWAPKRPCCYFCNLAALCCSPQWIANIFC